MLLYPALIPLLDELEQESEPYLVYLRGLVYMRLDRRQNAIESFTQSVRERPYNWSCWSQLAQLVNSADMVRLNDRAWPGLIGFIVHRAQGTTFNNAYAHLLRYQRHA